MRRYFALHLQHLIGSLGRAARQPVGTLLTVLVIAVALALPAGLRVAVINIDVLSDSWGGVADFTVILKDSVDETDAARVAAALEGRDDVASVLLITRDEALEEFRAASGFGDALDLLDSNPLPHTLVVRPRSEALADLEGLAADLAALDSTEFVELDREWLDRLRAIIELVQRFVYVAAGVLGLAVLVLIGNTIRLEINARRDEIEVIKLVGGSDGFIRRPFLYLGFWYGVLGALAAVLLLGAVLLLLRAPVARLAGLYGSPFVLAGLPWSETGFLLVGGGLLGWAGAGFAAARHLRAIEPT